MALSMSSDADVIIRARHLAKAYRLYDNPNRRMKQAILGAYRTYYTAFWALKDINFEVRRGDSVGILGRNGCGKSTLLQIICGITRPTKGELWVNGRVAPVLALGATFDLESTGRENVLIGGGGAGPQGSRTPTQLLPPPQLSRVATFPHPPPQPYSLSLP